MADTAEALAPLIGVANLVGFAAALWLLRRTRGTPLATGAWVFVVGSGLHVLNDYLPLLLNYAEPDDAYDHLFIHATVVVGLAALAVGVAKLARDDDAATPT